MRNIHDFLEHILPPKFQFVTVLSSDEFEIEILKKKIVKQQKVFDGKLGDKHQKWVQQQWRRYSTSPGSVCVLSLC